MTSKFGTIGIEIEFTKVPQRLVDAVHDASVESRIHYNNGNFKIGGEIVSPVLYNHSDVKEWLLRNMKTLRLFGEDIKGSQRDSIHIHVGFPVTNVIFLKKALKWAIKIDKHLFKLGGFGETPRGVINDFLYYRPLCSPHIIETRNGWGKVFDINDMMKIKTERGFWTRLGDSLNITSRYVAARYVGINFYSIRRHGTLEFRHFNKFLSPDIIATVAEFLSSSVIKAVSSSDYQLSTLNTFEDFIKFSEISPYKRDLLLNYYYKTKWNDYDRLCKQYIISHLVIKGNSPMYYRRTKYCPKIIPEEKLKEPVITDVHSGNYDIYIGG